MYIYIYIYLCIYIYIFIYVYIHIKPKKCMIKYTSFTHPLSFEQVAGHGIPLLDILMGYRDGDALLQAILGAYGASREARGSTGNVAGGLFIVNQPFLRYLHLWKPPSDNGLIMVNNGLFSWDFELFQL